MAIKQINLGSSAGAGDGEPLYSAFQKTNENFTDHETRLNTIENGVVKSDGTVVGTLLPDTNVTYDIGSATKRFKDLYLSGNTIDLGGTALSIVAGKLQVGGASVSTTVDYNDLQNKPTIPADVGDLTDTGGLLGGGVTSVNGDTGSVTLTADDITEGSTNLYYTNTRVDARITAAGSANWNTAYGWGDHSVAGYLTSVPAQSFASLTGKPTTISGYGITDAQSTLVSGTSIKTINGTSLLGSGDVTISGGGGADLSAVNQNYTPDTDNAYDLGIEAGNWLRSGYYRTSVVIGSGQYANATLTYNADGQLQIGGAGINTYALYSSSYMSIEPKYGGLIFWMDGDAGGGTLGYSSNNGSNEMSWSGDMYSNGPTYQLDNDQANLQIGAEVTKTISGITLGAITSLNFSDPYYANPNSTVTITGVVGTTELNNQTYFISGNELYTDAALTTPLNSSAFTPYVSGGTAVIAPRGTMSLPVLHSAPTTPKSGMMAVADGTNWNPTSTGTETMVVYLGGAWRTIANA